MPSEDSTKRRLYGVFQKTEDWQDNLHRKLAHKSLDIADPDEVNVDNSRTGIGWKELAILAATGLGGFCLYNQNQSGGPMPQSNVQQVAPVDSEYDVRFYDKDGKLIDIQPLPKGAMGQ